MLPESELVFFLLMTLTGVLGLIGGFCAGRMPSEEPSEEPSTRSHRQAAAGTAWAEEYYHVEGDTVATDDAISKNWGVTSFNAPAGSRPGSYSMAPPTQARRPSARPSSGCSATPPPTGRSRHTTVGTATPRPGWWVS